MTATQQDIEAFVGRFATDLAAVLHGATVVIGDKLGLYTALAGRGPSTPAELALGGRILAHLVPLRELSVALTAKLAQGASPVIEAALVKDLGTELEQAIPNLLADAIAADLQAEWLDVLLRTLSYVLQVCPTFSLRGGTREILRGVIARGLGLR